MKTTYTTLPELLQNRIFHHFAKLCQIPHPSFQEKAISDYVYGWALSLGLKARQDAWHNVYIRKSATPGYEEKPTVLLQAHLDMVCQKAPGIDHDFAKDPIPLELQGDLLSTGGRTTLGADDGIGVALIMALLEEPDFPHPELEALFTTAEEEDMSGAQNADLSDSHAKYLINIDNAVETHSVTGSCGGFGVRLSLPVTWERAAKDSLCLHVRLSGLLGGHSGEDIHRGRGNANVLLGRLLLSARQAMPLQIASLEGGTFRLAIPREAEAVVLVPKAQEATFRNQVEGEARNIKREYGAAAKTMTVTIEATEAPVSGFVVSKESTDQFLRILVLSPDGISEHNSTLTTIVQSSDNLGEIRLEAEENRFVAVYEIRTTYGSKAEYLFTKIQLLAKLAGGTCEKFAAYPGWPYNPDSRLVPQVQKLYSRLYGRTMEATPIHTGLECGGLLASKPDLDAISLGPDCWDLHAPQERLSVASTLRIYNLLKELVKEIQ